MKKLICFIAVVTLCLSLCGCGKKDIPSSNGGVPVNTVPHRDDRTPAQSKTSATVTEEVTQSSEVSVSEAETEVTGEVSVTTPSGSVTEKTTKGSTVKTTKESEPEEDITVVELMAMDCLDLLNSHKVHARFLESVSYDNEYADGTEREYFINGRNAVFINEDMKIIMTDKEVTVIDLSAGTYYTYERESGEGENNFGYSKSRYTFESSDISDDGTITEVYSVKTFGDTVTSTWIFYPSGNITVAEVSRDFGSYYWYSFDVLETDVSKMDMTIPDGLVRIEPEDF